MKEKQVKTKNKSERQIMLKPIERISQNFIVEMDQTHILKYVLEVTTDTPITLQLVDRPTIQQFFSLIPNQHQQPKPAPATSHQLTRSTFFSQQISTIHQPQSAE